jgi:hypothetical protein
MEAAYQNLLRDTEDALLGEKDSDLANAARELFGENYVVSEDPERLPRLLHLLHEQNIHQLVIRLAANEHIDRTVERDKNVFAVQKVLKREADTTILGQLDQDEEQLTVAGQGKNHKKNKKTAAKRKEKARAKKAQNLEAGNAQEGAATNDLTSSAKDAVWTTLEEQGAISLSTPDQSTKLEGAVVESPIEGHILSSSPATLESGAVHDAVLDSNGSSLSPTGTLDSVKKLIVAVGSEVSGSATHNGKDQEASHKPTLPDSHDVQQGLSNVLAGEWETALTNGDNHGWQQVQGKRKKSKKDKNVEESTNATIDSSSMVSSAFKLSFTIC